MPTKEQPLSFEIAPSPSIFIRRVFMERGIKSYRIEYGSDIIFINDDGKVEAASQLTEQKKEQILKNWKKYKNTKDGKAAIAAANK